MTWDYKFYKCPFEFLNIMREIALLGVLVGIKESASHFNVSEEKVQKYITEVVGDPFFKNIRELILMSITYSDVPTAAKDF